MSKQKAVKQICNDCGNDRTRMMDIVRAVQAEFGCVDGEALGTIAQAVGCQRVEVESCVSFYAFLSTQPKGDVVIRLCDDIIDEMKGACHVGEALVDELGIDFGETTEDGLFSLEKTPCIGMSDQAPAMMVNDVIFTYVGADQARSIVQALRTDSDPTKLVHRLGDGNNAHELVRSPVHNNIRKAGPVVLPTSSPAKPSPRPSP